MASEILVDADGYTLTDEAGFELDQTCVERCCAPAGECPTPCGRVWRVCVRKWRATRTRRVRITHPGYGVVEDSTLIVIHEMREADGNGTVAPWRLDPVDPASDGIDGPCQFAAAGLVPTRRVLEETNPRSIACLGPFSPFRQEQLACEQLSAWCTSPESAGENPAPGNEPSLDVPVGARSPLILPLAAVGFGAAFARAGVVVGAGCEVEPAGEIPWGTVVRTVRCVLGPIGNPTGQCVSTATIRNNVSWRYGKTGISYYRQSYRADQAGQTPVVCNVGANGQPVVIGCGELVASDEIEIEVEWEHSTLVENDGTERTGCTGNIPGECFGDLVYVEGRSCDRRGASRVYLPRENVRECGTIALGPAIDAQGRQACYRFDPHQGITPNLPSGATVYDAIVDKYSSAPDCCGCGARQSPPVCDAVDLREQMGADGLLKPNWLGWRRNAGGVLERVGGVLGINVAGVCCCRGSDIITVNFVESELTAFGVRELWKLREGRGLRARFRRDQRWPVGDPANSGGDSTFGQFISDIFELLPDGSQGPQIDVDGYAWGQALNEPQMPCEWTTLLSDYFDFDRPHEAVGTWNNSQGTQFGRLAAPGDVDRDDFVNGFRLMEWTPYVTCQFFNFIGRYEHMNGGELVNRVRLTIERPEVVGDPCSGGCGGGEAGGGGGGGGAGLASALGPRHSALLGGCGGCGGDEARL